MLVKKQDQCSTQTLYGTSATTVPATVVSSMKVPGSQTPVVQTTTTSTCVSTPGGGNFLATARAPSTVQSSSAAVTTGSSATSSYFQVSHRGHTSTDPQSASSVVPSRSAVRQVGTPQRHGPSISTTSATATGGMATSLNSTHGHHPRFLHIRRDFRKLGQDSDGDSDEDSDGSQCSWSTFVTTITSSAQAEATWSTTIVTTSTESLVTFSTGTTLVGCQPSPASAESASNSISSPPSDSDASSYTSSYSWANVPWSTSSTSVAPISTHHTQIQAVQTSQTSSDDWASSSEDWTTVTTSSSPPSSSPSSPQTSSSPDTTPLTSPTSSPSTLTNTPTTIQHEAASNPSSTSSASSSSASPGITVNADNSKKTSNTGVSAGAAIGGIVGMLAVIALVLFCIRWYKRRKRQERTEHLRSSWFYGGDVSIPSPSGDSHGSDTASQHSRAPMTSRFSAPSVRHSLSQGASRLSRVAPFLAHPIEHMRKTSTGRFPVPNLGGIGAIGMPFGARRTEGASGSYEEKLAETGSGTAPRISPPRPILMSGPTTTATTFSLLPDPPMQLGALDTPPILDFPLPSTDFGSGPHPYAQATVGLSRSASGGATHGMEVLSTARPAPQRIVSAAERASGSWAGLDEPLSYVPVDRTHVLLAVQNPDIHITAPSATSSMYSVATVSERGAGADAARVSRVGAYRPAAQRPVSDRSEKITRGGGGEKALLYPVPSMPVAHRPTASGSSAGGGSAAPQVDLSLPQLPLFLPPFAMDSTTTLEPGGDRQTQATSSVFEYDRSGRESLAASSFKTTREERMTRDWYDRDTWVGEGSASGGDGSVKQERKKSVRWDDGPRVL